MSQNPCIKIGIIGGTGLDQDSSILKNPCKLTTSSTPYGKPSDPELIYGQIHDIDVYIIGRHGRKHQINPSNVNYRANLWILKQFGCTHVLATTACGSLKLSIAPGDLGVLDQYIDQTRNRGGRTFYQVAHIPQSSPFDPTLQRILAKSAQESGHTCHSSLTGVCIEGPRFSTLAESRLFQSWNADLVNMTLVPEVQLANELGFIYASLALVTDYDCWHSEHASVSVEVVDKTLKELSSKAKDVLVRSIAMVKQHDWSEILEAKRKMVKISIMTE